MFAQIRSDGSTNSSITPALQVPAELLRYIANLPAGLPPPGVFAPPAPLLFQYRLPPIPLATPAPPAMTLDGEPSRIPIPLAMPVSQLRHAPSEFEGENGPPAAKRQSTAADNYRCLLCSHTFYDPTTFRHHLNNFHRGADYSCWSPNCITRTRNPGYLVTHYEEKHGLLSQSKGCGYCTMKAPTLDEIQRHMAEHFLSEFPRRQAKFFIPCEPTGLVKDGCTYFKRSETIEPFYQPKPMPAALKNDPYTCTHKGCFRINFVDILRYQEHMLDVHNQRDNFRCWHAGCKISLGTPEGLRKHIYQTCQFKPKNKTS